MEFMTVAPDDFPGASKPMAKPVANFLNLTAQYSFTEFPSPPDNNTAYDLFMNNIDGSLVFLVALFGDGNVDIQIGPPALAPTFSGLWTPNNGSHIVHVTVDSLGTPSLFIDGVPISVVFAGDLPTLQASLPDNTVSLFAQSDVTGLARTAFKSVFFSSGALPANVVFCCP